MIQPLTLSPFLQASAITSINPENQEDIGCKLMLQFQAGDEDAFRELFHQYQTRIYHIIYRYFQDGDLSEELTQETFLRVYQSKKTYTVKSKFITWICSIAVHLCLNTLRKRKREVSLDAPVGEGQAAREFPDKGAQPDEIQSRSEIEEAVARGIQDLPESQRALMILVTYEEMPIHEAAETLGITALGARLRLMRARATLKKKLKKYT